MSDSDVLRPVILFNKMLMKLKEEYERLECPIAKYCPFYGDECLGKYMYCPIYIACKDGSVAKCIYEMLVSHMMHDTKIITWRDIPSLINAFFKSSEVIE